MSDEYRLHNYLNDGYNPIVRPVIKPETKIELKFDVALQQLIGVVSKYLKKKRFVTIFVTICGGSGRYREKLLDRALYCLYQNLHHKMIAKYFKEIEFRAGRVQSTDGVKVLCCFLYIVGSIDPVSYTHLTLPTILLV